jgi:hypothetical protein
MFTSSRGGGAAIDGATIEPAGHPPSDAIDARGEIAGGTKNRLPLSGIEESRIVVVTDGRFAHEHIL